MRCAPCGPCWRVRTAPAGGCCSWTSRVDATIIFLKTIVPMFPNIERVLLTGISAGGFGASANTPQVMAAFPSTVKGILIDDSGPAMSSKYLPPCLQDKWRNLWGMDNSMLKDCGADCPNKSDFVLDFSKHLAKTYGDRKSGIIESSEDGIIRGFFGAGQNDCNSTVTNLVPGPTFTEGLLDFRSQLTSYPNFYTYFPREHAAHLVEQPIALRVQHRRCRAHRLGHRHHQRPGHHQRRPLTN